MLWNLLSVFPKQGFKFVFPYLQVFTPCFPRVVRSSTHLSSTLLTTITLYLSTPAISFKALFFPGVTET